MVVKELRNDFSESILDSHSTSIKQLEQQMGKLSALFIKKEWNSV